jgi:hypothetical protein
MSLTLEELRNERSDRSRRLDERLRLSAVNGDLDPRFSGDATRF